MKEIAPKGGYNFEEKQKYRKQIWDTFAKELNPETAVVAFLPSKEGFEIPIALKRGFKEENLIAIDKNPALIACAGWRKEYPKVKFYGSNIIRATERILNDKINIDAVNLDLCGNLSLTMMQMVKKIVDENIKSIPNKKLIVAITMFEGREQHAINYMADIIIESSKPINHLYNGFNTNTPEINGINLSKRLYVLLYDIFSKNDNIEKIQGLNAGHYINNSRSKMAWGIFSFLTAEFLKKLAQNWYNENANKIKDIEAHCNNNDDIYDLNAYCFYNFDNGNDEFSIIEKGSIFNKIFGRTKILHFLGENEEERLHNIGRKITRCRNKYYGFKAVYNPL